MNEDMEGSGIRSRIVVDDVENKTPEQAAMEVLEKTVMNGNRLLVPVDVKTVASALHLEYQPLPLEPNVDGLLVKDKPNVPFKAVVNVNENVRRQRFTLAHEIGHYIHQYQDHPDDRPTGKTEYRDELSSTGKDSNEIWANQFAAALLMPRFVMLNLWGRGKSVREIADLLSVSTRSVVIRLDNLGLK